jgi:hypothetical protein
MPHARLTSRQVTNHALRQTGLRTELSLHRGTLLVPVEVGLLHYGQLFSRTVGVLFGKMVSRFLRLVVRDVIRRRNSAVLGVRQWGHARPDET